VGLHLSDAVDLSLMKSAGWCLRQVGFIGKQNISQCLVDIQE